MADPLSPESLASADARAPLPVQPLQPPLAAEPPLVAPAVPAIAAPQLHYAPPVRGQRHPFVVVAAGLFTSVLTLLAVFLVARFGGPNLMGWNVYWFIPVGALLVGLVAASGYGIASRLTHVRISGSLGLLIVALQVFAYFVARYLEFRTHHLVYRNTGQPVGFWDYFHYTTMSYVIRHGNGGTTPLDGFGYVIRACEIGAFAFGAMIIPTGMSAAPYCELCRVYKKRCPLALFPASNPYRKFSDADAEGRAAYQAEQEEMLLQAREGAELLAELAGEGDAAAFRAGLAVVEPEQKSIAKLPMRLELALLTCKNCGTAVLETNLLVGQSSGQRRRKLAVTDLPPGFVDALAAPPGQAGRVEN